jgi:hypothetical protein
MSQLEIIFIGLITFLSNDAMQGRSVAVLDMAAGTHVHGHRVQEHAALLRVPKEAYIESSANWRPTTGKDEEKIFSLKGYALAIEGTKETPFAILNSYQCLVPKLTVECPMFGKLRPRDEIRSMSAATLELTTGTLSACRPEKTLPAATIWSIESEAVITISATGKGETRWLKIRPSRIRIENEPADEEVVGNHFIAFYKLSENEGCCTNLPFQRKLQDCPESVACSDISILTTAACSNSNYP